jgi:hypothetical protein
MPVFTPQRETNCIEASLQWIDDVSAGTLEKTQATYFSRKLRVPDDVLQLNWRDFPVVNNVAYLGVTFDRMMTWRHHIERIVANDLFTYIGTNFLYISGRVSTDMKLKIYKALIRSVMTYVCPICEYAADAQLKPRMTVLSKTSSNLGHRPTDLNQPRMWVGAMG